MQAWQQILTKGGRSINFSVPVFKPAGLCALRLLEAFRLDLYFVLDHQDIKTEPLLTAVSRFTEPFASGILTLIVGVNSLKKKKNFFLTDYVYDMTIEFGVQREFVCIDGPVTRVSDIRGLNEAKIRGALKNFEGTIKQHRMSSYRLGGDENCDPLQLMTKPDWNVPLGMSSKDVFNEIMLPPIRKNPNKLPQKYTHRKPERDTTIKSIELIRYSEPYGEFRISCDGSFVPRMFVLDFASCLGTQASLVSLTRVQEGPMHKDDLRVLQPYEVNLDYYSNRLPIYREIYEKFHNQLDPKWENRRT